jgi:hypothetical protein
MHLVKQEGVFSSNFCLSAKTDSFDLGDNSEAFNLLFTRDFVLI